MIAAEFWLQLINASFFLILNIYLAKKGYTDSEIGRFVKYRFMAVMLIALPLGLALKGKRMRPMFFISAFGVPTLSILTIYAAEHGYVQLLNLAYLVWGFCFAFLQVGSLPYILRNCAKETVSKAIALNFTVQSVTAVLAGFLIYFLQQFNLKYFSDAHILYGISILGFISVYHLLKIKVPELVDGKEKLSGNIIITITNYEWRLLIRAILPTLMLAIGAGLTIPFMNLFFFRVFGLDSDRFALIGSAAAILVSFGNLLVPFIKTRHGYKVAITLSQSLAIVALVLMGSTQYFSEYRWALYAAIFFYMVRQPLMNMAAPMTSELAMNYVGKKNREMLSAIIAAIWSGSWYFSSEIFILLVNLKLPYSSIFLITAAFYIVGVALYYLLIIDFEKRKVSEE